MNGWALGSHALITPVLEPKSLDELLHDDGDIAALKLDLDPGKDTTALLGAGTTHPLPLHTVGARKLLGTCLHIFVPCPSELL